MVRVLVTFPPERVALMVMLDTDSDTSTVLPFGNTLVQVNCGVGSPVAVQLRMAGVGERTFTSMGSPSRMTETVDKKFKCLRTYNDRFNTHSAAFLIQNEPHLTCSYKVLTVYCEHKLLHITHRTTKHCV